MFGYKGLKKFSKIQVISLVSNHREKCIFSLGKMTILLFERSTVIYFFFKAVLQ